MELELILSSRWIKKSFTERVAFDFGLEEKGFLIGRSSVERPSRMQEQHKRMKRRLGTI